MGHKGEDTSPLTFAAIKETQESQESHRIDPPRPYVEGWTLIMSLLTFVRRSAKSCGNIPGCGMEPWAKSRLRNTEYNWYLVRDLSPRRRIETDIRLERSRIRRSTKCSRLG